MRKSSEFLEFNSVAHHTYVLLCASACVRVYVWVAVCEKFVNYFRWAETFRPIILQLAEKPKNQFNLLVFVVRRNLVVFGNVNLSKSLKRTTSWKERKQHTVLLKYIKLEFPTNAAHTHTNKFMRQLNVHTCSSPQNNLQLFVILCAVCTKYRRIFLYVRFRFCFLLGVSA